MPRFFNVKETSKEGVAREAIRLYTEYLQGKMIQQQENTLLSQVELDFNARLQNKINVAIKLEEVVGTSGTGFVGKKAIDQFFHDNAATLHMHLDGEDKNLLDTVLRAIAKALRAVTFQKTHAEEFENIAKNLSEHLIYRK